MKIITQNIETLLAIVLFVCALVFYLYNPGTDDKLLLGLIGAIATLYFGLIKFKIENDSMFKELFIEFNERYSGELNNLINSLKDNPKRVLSNNEKNIIRNYFNLCAEEYLWKSKGRIPSNVWSAWKSGMMSNLEIAQIRDLWLEEIATDYGRKSYYGLPEEVGL